VTATGEQRVTKAADGGSFDDFYRSELDRQVRRAYLLIGSADLADDIVHDAMVGMYRRWSDIDQPAAYLNRAVLNGCRDVGRRAARQRRLMRRISERPDESTPRDVLDDVLAGLPFQQRAAVVLRYYESRTTAEIAQMLGCAPGSVGPWIDRALIAMRKALA
jgi:RNA polymerase sigma factor (sigma-70 family)